DAMLELVGQIAGAVACLHEKRIVHRDLKPGNLILSTVKSAPSGVTLIDLGEAKLEHEPDDWASLDDPWVPGTPLYMAPEQARGDGTSPASDVYAMGAIAYELLTGKAALALKQPDSETCLAYLRSERPLPVLRIEDLCPSVHPETSALIQRCLSRVVQERPEDADALKCEVDSLIAKRPPPPEGLRRVLRGVWPKGG
ncbi:MAG: protein kinase, partial [Myxococcota bacterium]|nr:protein kinase [Myxococcota bacterium]